MCGLVESWELASFLDMEIVTYHAPNTLKIVLGSLVDTYMDLGCLKCRFRPGELVMQSVLELSFSSTVEVIFNLLIGLISWPNNNVFGIYRLIVLC